MTTRWINIILGLWLVLAPFVLNYLSGAAVANDVIVGILVVAIAAFGFKWANARWVHTALGVWLIIAPFLLGHITRRAVWNDVILGVLILLFSFLPSRRLSAVGVPPRAEERPPSRV